MWPVLFEFKKFSLFGLDVGPITIYFYGFFIALGFFLAVVFGARYGKTQGIKPEKYVDIAIVNLISSLIGARILFIFTRWSYYMKNPTHMFQIWEGGVVFYGGLILGTIAILVMCRINKISVIKYLDVTAPGMALGHAVGRLGCLFAGCCFGKITSMPWGITFTNEAALARPLNMPLHPTQLYESGSMLLLFLFYLITLKRPKFKGQMFLTYFIYYSVVRFVIEYFRGDKIRGFVIEPYLSTSQFIAVLFFVTCLSLWIYLYKRSKRNET